MEVARSELVKSDGGDCLRLDGADIPLVSARDVLSPGGEENQEEVLPVILIGTDTVAFAVDRCIGERDLVVKPIDPRLGPVPCVAAVAVSSGGEAVLILDVQDTLHWSQSIRDGTVDALCCGAQPHCRGRILVVDDSATVREMERRLFESRGYAVDLAVDGMDGWNAVTSRRYDVVVTDVDMPRMDGITFIKKMRADARFIDVPIVVVSYKDRQEDRKRGLDAGADRYMTQNSFQDASLAVVVDGFMKKGRR